MSEPEGRGGAWTEERQRRGKASAPSAPEASEHGNTVSEPDGRGGAWTEERQRRGKASARSALEASEHGNTVSEPDGRQQDNELLRTRGLAKVYRSDGVAVEAVRGVDIEVGIGEFVAIMGPSGSGKSTLLHVLGGLEPTTRGEIWLRGQRVDQLSKAAWAILRRHHVGFVFQFFNLLSNMTVADNVELPALLAGATTRQARKRREELLGQLGLAAKADSAPARLSGGEQQRVALARALANEPSLLLADEPTGNLDSSNTRDVLRLLQRTHAAGQTILLVTHDARVASLADRVINLFDGMVADDARMVPIPYRRDKAGRPVDGVRDVLELRG